MDHFEFKVGTATVRVHQAFSPGETAYICIVSDDEEKTLVVDRKGSLDQVEIKRVD